MHWHRWVSTCIFSPVILHIFSGTSSLTGLASPYPVLGSGILVCPFSLLRHSGSPTFRAALRNIYHFQRIVQDLYGPAVDRCYTLNPRCYPTTIGVYRESPIFNWFTLVGCRDISFVSNSDHHGSIPFHSIWSTFLRFLSTFSFYFKDASVEVFFFYLTFTSSVHMLRCRYLSVHLCALLTQLYWGYVLEIDILSDLFCRFIHQEISTSGGFHTLWEPPGTFS